ncbi:MAG: carbon-nitrogen hydrolase family protein [Fuerstiella sp.]
MIVRLLPVCALFVSLCAATSVFAGDLNWSAETPRDEIRPVFRQAEEFTEKGTRLVINADDREGLNGWWTTTLPVQGRQHFRFSVKRQTTGMSDAEIRRAAVVRLLWENAKGGPVVRDEPTFSSYRPGEKPRAEPEFPPDVSTSDGWTTVSQIYRAPITAQHLRIELHFRWGPPKSQVVWKDVRLEPVAAPDPRPVKLATIHLQPREGKTPAEKRIQFASLIADAATQGADLIVLPETLTVYGTGLTYAECAENVPGPSTDYFGKLARQYDTHIVAGLLERDKHLIYNVSVLLGPDGNIIGKNRKTTLPRGEIVGGITPGNEYPVLQTRFGKVGMMICYDGFFPEVARELTKNGAEVIAWPVWGCNPMLGAARACENHVYVVSSTYTDASRDWMITGIYGHDGKVLSQAKTWGSVAITEVDLNKPMYWHSLGDFKAQIERHRPLVPGRSSEN